MSEVLNTYQLKMMQQYLENCENPAFDETQMKYHTLGLIIGGTGQGKTNILLNYIMRSKGAFHRIFICNRGVEEPIYELLQDLLGDKQQISFCTHENLPDCMDLYAAKPDKKEQWLIIFDDLVTEMKTREVLRKVSAYATTARKLGFTSFFLSQNYFDIPKLLRQQAYYLLLLGLNSPRDLNMIMKDGVNLEGATGADLRRVHAMATEKPMSFLKIKLGPIRKDPAATFTRDFTLPFFIKKGVDEKGEKKVAIYPGTWYEPDAESDSESEKGDTKEAEVEDKEEKKTHN